MKVLSAECYGAEDGVDTFELEVLQHLKSEGSKFHGSAFITMLEDSFEHMGPNGRHRCLIFQVMAESLASFRQWFPEKRVPNVLVQQFAAQLLEALSWAHSCGILHTGRYKQLRSIDRQAYLVIDIQPGNIMIRNPDETHLRAYLEKKYCDFDASSVPSRPSGIIRIQSLRSHYFPHPFDLNTLRVALADWGVASWSHKHLSETIQPTLLRCPEVILEASWDQSADIWNLGALVPELIYGQLMFSGGEGSAYSIEGHLAEISALLGSFPPRLLSQARLQEARVMFDTHGNMHKLKLKHVVSLTERFEDLTDGEGQKLEEFVRALLALDPTARPVADEALELGWLSHEYTQAVAVERVQQN